MPVGSNLVFSDGYLFYVKEGTLTAQAFDPARLSFAGKPIPIAARVEFYSPRTAGYFSVSHNLLVYRSSSVQDRELAWFDLSGTEVEHWGEAAPFVSGTFSPASQMAVLNRQSANGNGTSLWLVDVQRKAVIRLTADSELVQTGVVFPNGNQMLIAATVGFGRGSLVRRDMTASRKEEKLLDDNDGGGLSVLGISRDGRYAIFQRQDPKTSWDIYYMDSRARGN